MKLMKKMVSLLLCFVLLATNAPFAFAANGEANIYGEVSATQVEVGEKFTFTLYINEMTAQGVKAGFYFDNTKLEIDKISWEDIVAYSEDEEDDVDNGPLSKTTKKKANTDGAALGVYVINSGVDSLCYEGVLAEVTFIAIANGEAKITLREETEGTDEYKSDSVETLIVTVGSPEPEHTCTPGAVSYEKGTNGKHTKIVACADNCGENYSVIEEICSGGAADCEHAAVCEFCGNTYGEAKGHGKTSGFRYSHVAGTNTHNVICADCEKTVEKGVACTFKDNSHDCVDCDNVTACADEDNNHYCDVCRKELSKCADEDNNHYCDVCRKELSKCADEDNNHYCDVCRKELSKCDDKDGDGDHDCDVCGEPEITECSGGEATCLTPAICEECGEEYGKIAPENHIGDQDERYIDNGDDHTKIVFYPECEHVISETNEPHNYGDDFICDDCDHELFGWVEMNGDWYYVVDGKAVTGNVRVPYHKDYAPNAEDVAYAQSNADSKYTDAETAVFVFDENGVFQSDFTGIVDGNRYAVNGVIAWHVGLVEVDGVYYYFIGDEAGYGNIAAEGDIYVSRVNGIAGFQVGGVYNFDGGKLSALDGLVDRFGNGELYYYKDAKLMLGNGLTAYEGEYIYVRSNGQIVVDTKYWVANTNGICEPGMYTFDENGYLQTAKDPSVNGLVDGVYYKNGMPYYAGLIVIDGDTYYINSAGKVVTGTYYITKVDNYTGSLTVKRGDKLNFGTDGKLITP